MVVGTEIEAQASLLMTLAAELPTQAVPVEVLLTVIFATTVVGNKDIKAQASLLRFTERTPRALHLVSLLSVT